jgi:hypothetical protein
MSPHAMAAFDPLSTNVVTNPPSPTLDEPALAGPMHVKIVDFFPHATCPQNVTFHPRRISQQPVGILYRPPENKMKNAKPKDYLGKAKLVAAESVNEAYTTFTGVTRMQQGFTPTGAPIERNDSTLAVGGACECLYAAGPRIY